MKQYQKLPLASLIKTSVPSPKIEFSEQQIEKLKHFGGVVLCLVGIAGLVTVAALAPNALQALKLFEKRRGRKRVLHKEKIEKFTRTIYYLKRRGEISFKRNGNDYEAVLTYKGKKRLKKLNFETLTISKPKIWDKKFWLVAADIPVKYKSGADAFRQKIKELGLYSLQRTLWFYAFDPRAELEFVARAHGVSSFVTEMKLEHIDPEDEKQILHFFREAKII